MSRYTRIVNRVSAQTMMEYPAVPMVGKLKCSQKDGSYAILEVPKDFVESISKAIWKDGMEKPPNYSPHISVITDEELEQIGGKDKIKEDGQEFTFTLDTIESCDPEGWDEMEMVYFVKVKSPQLEALREKYGLTPLIKGDHEFHVSISVVPKKTAALIERVAASVVIYRVHQQVSDTELNRLLVKLKQIASIKTLSQARERWLDEVVERRSEHDDTPISTHITTSDDWEKDRKALFIAASFFSDKQKLLPVKIQTIKKRLNDLGPYDLRWEMGNRADRWIKGVVSLAVGFIKSIAKWRKIEKSDTLQHKLKVGKFDVLNAALVDDKRLKEYVGFLKKVQSIVPSKYCYGEVKITTKKELGRGTTWLAYYSAANDDIALINDARGSRPLNSIVHELGHRVWHKFIDGEDKRVIRMLFEDKKPDREINLNSIFFLVRAILVGNETSVKVKVTREVLKTVPSAMDEINEVERKADVFWKKTVADVKDFANKMRVKTPSDKDIKSALSLYFNGKQSYSPRSSSSGRQFWLEMLDAESGDFDGYLQIQRRKSYNIIDDVAYAGYLWTLYKDASGHGGESIFPTAYSKRDVGEFWAENFVEKLLGNKIHPLVEIIITNYL